MAALRRFTIGLAQVIGVLLLMFGSYYGWSQWELNRLEALCTEIHSGDEVTGLGSIVEKHGFDRKWVEHGPIRELNGDGYISFIPAASTFGEATCTIRYNDNAVMSAKMEW